MLRLPAKMPVQAQNAGLFISGGQGIHPTRTLKTYELIFVRRGRLVMVEEGRRFEVTEGQTLLLWPRRRHWGGENYESKLSFYWIHFYGHPAKAGALQIPQHSFPERAERIAELFHRFLNEQEAGTLSPLEANLLLMLLLVEASGARKKKADAGHLSIRAKTFIEENFYRSPTASVIANSLGMNADYLGRIFHKAHGCTLTQALHQRQISEARSLLRDSKMNINEIALACGFSDTRYFRRIFRRYQGIGPRQYRQLHSRMHVNVR